MIRKYTIVPPFSALAGDTFVVVAGVMQQKRHGVVIAARILSAMASVPITQGQLGNNTISTLFLEVPNMPALIVKVDSVVYNPTGSGGTINYSDSTSEEFDSRSALVASAVLSKDDVKKMAKAAWLARSADGSDPTWIAGKTFQLDVSLEMNQFQIGIV